MAVRKRPGNKSKQQIETPGVRQEKPEDSVDVAEQLKRKQQELLAANEKLISAEQELRTRTEELTSSEKRFKYNLEALTKIQELSRRLLASGGLKLLLQEIMDTAVELMAAERATLQLLEGDSLRIVAHHGHQTEFLEFFEAAENVASVCGEATHRGERVIVHDVEESPLFVGTPSLLVLRNAGVRSVQSTPIRSRAGVLLGILTTQWSVPHSPDEQDLWRLDLLVRQAADLIEHAKAKEEMRASEQRYRAYFNLPNVGIAITSLDKGWVEVNSALCDMLGYTRDELLLRTWSELTYPEDLERDLVQFRRISAGEIDGYSIEKRFLRKDQTVIWVELSGHSVRSEAGGIQYFVALLKDITGRKTAEEALSRKEAELELILERTPFMITRCSRDLRYLYASRTYAEMIGRTPDQLAGRPIVEIMGEKGLKTILPYVEAVLRGETVEYEDEVNFEGVGPRHLSVVYVPDTNGEQVIGWIASIRDITERKEAEQALAESEQRYRGIVETAEEGIATHEPGGTITYVNRRMADMLGYSREEIIGRSSLDFVDDEERKAVIRARESVKDQGSLTIERKLRRKDSSILYTLVNVSPRRDGAGNFLGYLAMHTDITERKRIEEETARLASFPILNPKPIIEVDFEGNVIFANPSAQRIFPELQKCGPKHPYMADWMNLKSACIESSNEITRDVIVADHWYTQTVHRLEGAERIRIYGSDITERKQAEADLLRAKEDLESRVQERTKELGIRANQLRALAGELTISEQRERKRLAILLHDHLQQLLVGAKFRLSVLGKTGDDGTKLSIKEIEQVIDESIKSSRSLTAELSPPILHSAGLNAGLEWLGRRMADTQGLFVDLTTEPIGSLPEDLTILLFEAVRELLFNIAKHAKTQAAYVKLSRINKSLQLTVSDEGVGFDPGALPAAGEGGRGFGLFSLGERIELFGGKLEIASAPGQGSRLVISMPIISAEPQSPGIAELPKEISSKLISTSAPGNKIRVLLADDHAIVRQGIANLLKDEPDIKIAGEAANGQEAVNLTGRMLPDVVLMDMNMPILNGVEATRAIHKNYPEIRVIGLSMFEEAEKAQEMRDAGAVNYVTKSGPAEDLINAIRKAMGHSQKAFSPNS